ncbi:MAG: winged helix-turn-helix transcriptional regulator [Clostridia bacterium]|nr:winged helix-turn-helix transcriptional regulator [Clostridia bacterium]
MLFDFYGELLTDKQREYFDLHYNEDLSLAEIAEQMGISRQGVWDIIRRAEAALRETEEKTGLIGRFTERREMILEIENYLGEIFRITEGTARDLAEQALIELRKLED